MNRRRMLLGVVGFPSEPGEYDIIGTYTDSGTFYAPEDGWFQIELYGASGTGGARYTSDDDELYAGGGGGGGGCAISRVKMKKGDSIAYTLGKANTATTQRATYAEDSSAVTDSYFDEYDGTIYVEGAGDGRRKNTTDRYEYPVGGTGGAAYGGNYGNYPGSSGESGDIAITSTAIKAGDAYGGDGGSAGYSGGNAGGKGYGYEDGEWVDGETGKNAFIKIYRGITNAV